MLPSKIHTSVTFDVSMTELRDLFAKHIHPEYQIPGSSITLSFVDSLTGQRVLLELDTSLLTIQASLNVSWSGSPSKEKSGAGPTS